ncbi:hypothetical protein L345_06111, partial [Ophiophagus hannah]
MLMLARTLETMNPKKLYFLLNPPVISDDILLCSDKPFQLERIALQQPGRGWLVITEQDQMLSSGTVLRLSCHAENPGLLLQQGRLACSYNRTEGISRKGREKGSLLKVIQHLAFRENAGAFASHQPNYLLPSPHGESESMERSEEIFPVDEMTPDVTDEGWSRAMDRTAIPRPAAERIRATVAAARAAQITFLVREGALWTRRRVKHIWGLRHGSEEESSGRAPPRHLHPHTRSKEIGQLLAGEGEWIAGTVRQSRRAQEVITYDGRRGYRGGAVQQPVGSNSTWEASKAETVLEAGSFSNHRLSTATSYSPALLSIVDEMTARPVRAEANGMESATELRLVLGMAGQTSQLMDAVSKLALVSVFAGPILLKRAAELRLVAT